MKIKLMLIVCLVVGQVNTYAQKNAITFKTGASIPVGKFASTDTDPLSGFASTGFYLGIDYTYSINKIVALNGSIKYFNNGTDTKALQTRFNEISSPVIAREPNVGNYSGVGFLAGLKFNIPTGEKFKTAIILGAGIMNLTNPTYKYDYSFNGVNGWLEQDKQTANGFAFELGADFKYSLTEKLDFLFNTSFLGNKASLKDVKTTYNNGDIMLFSGEANMNTVNVGAGLAYKF